MDEPRIFFTRASISLRPCGFQRVGHIAEHGHVGPYGIRLKHHPDPAALREGDAFVFNQTTSSPMTISPESGDSRPAMQRRSVVLPHRKSRRVRIPLGGVGGHVVKRCYLLVFETKVFSRFLMSPFLARRLAPFSGRASLVHILFAPQVSCRGWEPGRLGRWDRSGRSWRKGGGMDSVARCDRKSWPGRLIGNVHI